MQWSEHHPMCVWTGLEEPFLERANPSWVPVLWGRCWWWHLASGGAVGLFSLHLPFSWGTRLLYAHYLWITFWLRRGLPDTTQTTWRKKHLTKRKHQLPCIAWTGFKIPLHVKWEWFLKQREFNCSKDSHFTKSSIKKRDPAGQQENKSHALEYRGKNLQCFQMHITGK